MPMSMGDQHFLNIEQIIPTKDVEDFMIGIADKSVISGKTGLHQNISPSSQAWISAGSGVHGVVFSLAASRTYGRAEVYIDRGDGKENMFISDQLHAQKDRIDAAFGGDLTWDPLEGKRACRIKSEMAGNIFDRDQWPAMIDFLTSTMVRMEKRFLRDPLAAINRKLRTRERASPTLVPTVEAAEGS